MLLHDALCVPSGWVAILSNGKERGLVRKKPPIKPHKRDKGQHVRVPYDMIKHPNFRLLSADAVRVWLEMHIGFNGSNNGCISFSVRQAAECLHSGMGRALKAINQLIAVQFIICTRDSSFNMKSGRAREWILTTQPMGIGAASNDWKKQRPESCEAQFDGATLQRY